MREKYKILVATHKRAPMPEDDTYLPVHVGHALSGTNLGFQADDIGENISERNKSYCELTGLYWAWKNVDADVIGLSHYRRYFAGTAPGPNRSRILSGDEARELLRSYDVVIARPRNYYIETIASHYRNAHHGEDLDVLRGVLAEKHPQYLGSFDRIMGGRVLSLYNMLLMRRDLFDEYAGWLFPLLSEVERRIDNGNRTAYQQRTFGYLGERLLNVWVDAHAHRLRVMRRQIVNTEGEPLLKKGASLIKRKLMSKPAV